MIERFAKLDFFENEIIYIDKNAQELYTKIIETGKEFFALEKKVPYHSAVVSDYYEKLRNYMFDETYGYSIFSRIEVKIVFYEKLIDYKFTNFYNHSFSRQNAYKKHLLDALKLLYAISLFKKSGSYDFFEKLGSKYYFLPFIRHPYSNEVYEGIVNEVDYFIQKLTELGLNVAIDFENGFITTNGLKYSFLNDSPISIDLQYKNPYPRIFKNKTCYDFFIWLKENLVKDEYADYSFIFYQMLAYELIYEVSHKDYIEFLLTLNVDLNYDKLKTSAKNSIAKKDKFKEGIPLFRPTSMVF